MGIRCITELTSILNNKSQESPTNVRMSLVPI